MPFSFVANCLFLTYGPLVAAYSATNIKNGITHFFGLPVRVLTIFVFSQVIKMVLLATLTPDLSQSDEKSWAEDIFSGIANIADAGGLYYLLSSKDKSGGLPVSSTGWLWALFSLILRYFLFFMYNSSSNEHDWNLIAYALTSNLEIVEIMTVAYLVSSLTHQSQTDKLVMGIIAILFVYQTGTLARLASSYYCTCSFVTLGTRALISLGSYGVLSRIFAFN